MSVTNLYPNLPGSLVEFRDGGLTLRTSASDVVTGKSILIIGTGTDGPIMEPVAIDVDTVSIVFGSEVGVDGFANGSTITKKVKEAYKTGFRDIRAMRATGKRAELEVSKSIRTNHETRKMTEALGQVRGNEAVVDKAVAASANGPIITDTFVLKTTSGQGVTYSSLSAYGKKLSIPANTVSAGATLNATFKYKDIQAEKTENFDLAKTEDGKFEVITLSEKVYITDPSIGHTPDQPNDEYGYKYSNGIAIVLTKEDGGTTKTLTEGTDYSVNYATGKIQLNDSLTEYDEGDHAAIKYIPYVEASGTDSFTLTSGEQTFVLAKVPKVETAIVKMNGNPVSTGFRFEDKKLILDPSKFEINDDVTISYSYEMDITKEEKVLFRSIYGGKKYNEAKVTIRKVTKTTDPESEEGRMFVFTKPESKKYSSVEQDIAFTSFNYPTLGELSLALRHANLNNVFELVTEDINIKTNDFPEISAKLSGGDDGLNPTANEMYEALSGKRNEEGYLTELGCYQVLENYSVDYIHPTGIYADTRQTVNEKSSFHDELCLACAAISYRTHMTMGLIDMTPNVNLTMIGIQNYVDKLVAYKNEHYMKDGEGEIYKDSDGNPIDIGWYTTLGVGPDPVASNSKLGTYLGSPILYFAGLNAQLPPQSSPTNKPIKATELSYSMSNKQLNDLIGNHMIAFKYTNQGVAGASKVPCVVDSFTCGSDNCDYKRVTTFDVVKYVVDQVREVTNSFIGEPNLVEKRNAMSAQISKRLGALLEDGVILYYDFEVNATTIQQVLGECSIALTLVAPQELRKITTVVSLKAAA